jgi:hypothetical protein
MIKKALEVYKKIESRIHPPRRTESRMIRKERHWALGDRH